MNRTANMNLVLYEANDIMDGTEFINANNNAIDKYTSEVKTTAEAANAAAIQANEGVGAADTKITAINKRLDNDNVDQLPGYMRATDARLETLEDDVNSFLKPVVNVFSYMDGSFMNNFYSGSILYINYASISASTSPIETNTLPVYNIGTTTALSGYAHRGKFGKAAGNIYNLEINKIYITSSILVTSSGGRSVEFGIYYDGVDTYLCFVSKDSTQIAGILNSFLPIGSINN